MTDLIEKQAAEGPICVGCDKEIKLGQWILAYEDCDCHVDCKNPYTSQPDPVDVDMPDGPMQPHLFWDEALVTERNLAVAYCRLISEQRPSDGTAARQGLTQSHVNYGRAIASAIADQIEAEKHVAALKAQEQSNG